VVATVPEEATGITFGVIHSGDGTAWFDSLSIEIAGIPAEAGFDLEFESLEGLQPRGEKHLLELDGANPHGGAFSLRSRYVGPAFPTARETAGMCAEVWRHMNERRQAYLDAGFDGRETDWAIQNARVAAQAAELAADPSSRDGAMAENVGWILDQNPGSKMVVWAHNGHVSASESSAAGSEPMGGFLRRALGQDVVLAGFSFNQGSFQAVDMQTRAVHPWSVGPAPAGTLDAGLADVGLPLFALDLREAPRAGAGSWLRTPLLTRSIGSVYDEAYARQYYNRTVPALAYDLLLFVERTTPSHLLDY
jgi:erythromycin esterase-like protein